MRVEVITSFLWAGEDGNTVRTVPAGAVVEGRCAAAAIATGSGLVLGARDAEEKALEGAPQNAAVARAPRNKGR